MIKPADPGRIKALTALRGYAALWVFFYHYFFTGMPGGFIQYIHFVGAPWLSTLNAHGYLAVDVFFILSGFIIAHVYLPLFASDGVNGRTFGIFMIRRVSRLYPVHLAAMLALALLSYLGIGIVKETTLSGFFLHLFLIQSWFPGLASTWNSPAWSASVEWAVYFLVPLLIYVLGHGDHWRFGLMRIGACFAALYGYNLAFHHGVMNYMLFPGMARGLLEFCVGFCLHSLYRQGFLKHLNWNVISHALLVSIAAGIICGVPDILMVMALSVYIYALAHISGRTDRMFSNRAALLLGVISYSLYLWHMPAHILSGPFYSVFSHLLPFDAGGQASLMAASIAFVGLVILWSYGSFCFIEKPARRAINRWQERVLPG